MHPGLAIACSFFEIMSMTKAYLDVIFCSAILLLCKHVFLLMLLLLLSHAKLSVNPFMGLSAVNMS